MQEDLQTLLEKHEARTLSDDERVRLHELLKEKHVFGGEMPEYKCPQCNKPLVYTWAGGPACIVLDGGCGYSFKQMRTN